MMRHLALLSASLLAFAGATAPAAAAAKGATLASASDKATCAAKYYDYMVGKDLTETRQITADDYRAVASGVAATVQNPKRVTFVYDAKSNKITGVACG
jgi:hypothetical protein